MLWAGVADVAFGPALPQDGRASSGRSSKLGGNLVQIIWECKTVRWVLVDSPARCGDLVAGLESFGRRGREGVIIVVRRPGER